MEQNEAAALVGNNITIIELCIRLLINIVCGLTLVRLIYYPLHKQKDHMFTFLLFNMVIFMTCLLLSSARIRLGFAFGLFAIFSIMRYRTVTIPVKEMGYFFVCVSIGILNALVSAEDNYLLLLAADAVIIGLVLLLEHFLTPPDAVKEVIYERIDLIVPEKRVELIADVKNRTGLPVTRVEIINIDLLHDTATLHVYHSKV